MIKWYAGSEWRGCRLVDVHYRVSSSGMAVDTREERLLEELELSDI